MKAGMARFEIGLDHSSLLSLQFNRLATVMLMNRLLGRRMQNANDIVLLAFENLLAFQQAS
jgi:hypothetical protein